MKKEGRGRERRGEEKGEERGKGGERMVEKKILIIIHTFQGRSKSHFQYFGVSLKYCRLWVFHSHLADPFLWRRWDETGGLSLTPLNV